METLPPDSTRPPAPDPRPDTDTRQSSGEQAAAKPERKRYGENLRHLMVNQGVEESPVTGTLSDRITVMFDKLRARPAAEAAAKQTAQKRVSSQVILDKGLRVMSEHKKSVGWAIVGIMILIAVIYITPLVSLQIERSAGFAAFEEERYQEAQTALVGYLNKRPSDHQAMYYAARAALYNGDTRYARGTFGRLYDTQAVVKENDVPYYYALVNLDQPKDALGVIERWLAGSPATLVGRLLRGVLLIGQPDAKRKMREDFLFVDDILQRDIGTDEKEKILFLHHYFQRSGQFSAILSPPLNWQTNLTASPLAVLLRFDPGIDGFVAKYNLSGGASFLKDDLSPAAIVNLYFAYGLMASGDTQESEVELKELQQESSDSPSLRQALAFLALYQNRQISAAQIFSSLLPQVGNDSQTRNNLATALWSSGSENATDIIAIYDDILALGGHDRVAINNGAFLENLDGDYAAAIGRLGKLASDNSFQYTLNLGLAELWQGRPARSVELLAAISPEVFPRINYYLAAVLEANGNSKDAIAVYRRIEESESDSDALIRRIRLMYERGDWRLAYNDLTPFLREHPDNAEAWYYRGLLALRLNESEELEAALTQLANQSEDWHYLNALKGSQFQNKGEDLRAAVAYRAAMESAPNGWSKIDYAVAWGEIEVSEAPQAVANILLPLSEENFKPELAAVLSRAVAATRPNLAREIAESALATPPSYRTIKNTGFAYALIGDTGRATELLQTAYQWQPTDANLLTNLIQVQTAAGDADAVHQSETALVYLRLAEQGASPLSEIEYKVAIPDVREIVKKIREYTAGNMSDKEVLAEYQNQLESAESKAEPAALLFSQATFYMHLDRLPEALGSFRAALNQEFSDPEQRIRAMLFFAEAQSEARQYQDALDTLSDLIASEGNAPLYDRLYAENLIDLGRNAESLSYLESAVQRFPGDNFLYIDLARAYYDDGKLEQALQTAERLIRISPNFAPAYDLLADIYIAKQDNASAADYTLIKNFLESSL